MLTRIACRLIAASTFVFCAVTSPAGAVPMATPTPTANPELVKVCTPVGCQFVPRSQINDPGKSAEPGQAGDGGKHVKSVCNFHGSAQACTSKLGNWSNSQQCYLHSVDPQPPFTDPVWKGRTDGKVWACVREQGYDLGKHLVTRWVWIPGKPDTVVVDPVTLAYQAIADMRLAPPLIKTAPSAEQIGLVNMPVWLWVTKTENTWGPIVRSASVPGVSVTATAQVKAIDWSMGDGSKVRCEGPGTAYTKAMGVKN
ncbi:ATP/GTP-binding protein [Kribbella aluminosa]